MRERNARYSADYEGISGHWMPAAVIVARPGVRPRWRTYRYCRQMRETEISRDGRVLRVRDAGDPGGAVVMYFHGTPGSRLDLSYGEDFAAGHGVRLVSFDRPGYGGSAPAPFGLASIGADAHAVADGLGVARFRDTGHVRRRAGGAGRRHGAGRPRHPRGDRLGAGPFRLIPGALDQLDDNDRAAVSLLPGDPAGAASAFAAGFEPLVQLSRISGGSGMASAFPGMLSRREP